MNQYRLVKNLFATKWQFISAPWQRLGLIYFQVQITPCKGSLIKLSLQDAIKYVQVIPQGLALGLNNKGFQPKLFTAN